MKSGISFYPKSRAFDGPSLVFLVSGLINALFAPQTLF